MNKKRVLNNQDYFDYWEYILSIKENYTDQQFHDILESLQPPCSLDKYTMLSYAECIALDDGIGELLELIRDEGDYKNKLNRLIKNLLEFKKSSRLDEVGQVKYLLHLIDDIIEGNIEFQVGMIQYDIYQVGSIVLYVEIISELYAVNFWEIYKNVPHERIMFDMNV